MESRYTTFSEKEQPIEKKARISHGSEEVIIISDAKEMDMVENQFNPMILEIDPSSTLELTSFLNALDGKAYQQAAEVWKQHEEYFQSIMNWGLVESGKAPRELTTERLRTILRQSISTTCLHSVGNHLFDENNYFIGTDDEKIEALLNILHLGNVKLKNKIGKLYETKRLLTLTFSTNSTVADDKKYEVACALLHSQMRHLAGIANGSLRWLINRFESLKVSESEENDIKKMAIARALLISRLTSAYNEGSNIIGWLLETKFPLLTSSPAEQEKIALTVLSSQRGKQLPGKSGVIGWLYNKYTGDNFTLADKARILKRVIRSRDVEAMNIFIPMMITWLQGSQHDNLGLSQMFECLDKCEVRTSELLPTVIRVMSSEDELPNITPSYKIVLLSFLKVHFRFRNNDLLTELDDIINTIRKKLPNSDFQIIGEKEITLKKKPRTSVQQAESNLQKTPKRYDMNEYALHMQKLGYVETVSAKDVLNETTTLSKKFSASILICTDILLSTKDSHLSASALKTLRKVIHQLSSLNNERFFKHLRFPISIDEDNFVLLDIEFSNEKINVGYINTFSSNPSTYDNEITETVIETLKKMYTDTVIDYDYLINDIQANSSESPIHSYYFISHFLGLELGKVLIRGENVPSAGHTLFNEISGNVGRYINFCGLNGKKIAKLAEEFILTNMNNTVLISCNTSGLFSPVKRKKIQTNRMPINIANDAVTDINSKEEMPKETSLIKSFLQKNNLVNPLPRQQPDQKAALNPNTQEKLSKFIFKK